MLPFPGSPSEVVEIRRNDSWDYMESDLNKPNEEDREVELVSGGRPSNEREYSLDPWIRRSALARTPPPVRKVMMDEIRAITKKSRSESFSESQRKRPREEITSDEKEDVSELTEDFLRIEGVTTKLVKLITENVKTKVEIKECVKKLNKLVGNFSKKMETVKGSPVKIGTHGKSPGRQKVLVQTNSIGTQTEEEKVEKSTESESIARCLDMEKEFNGLK